ncbi:AAA family ATPase [Arthrobacter sp. HY1533]|uniref:AAA family ATPase n=1 Tax=Arthrobacter sp. HY1533 TaxID=2970919 RepID=UPI0022BA0A2D|nr:AAA family ATPase [Arthrobacter sp. HY1533]
MEMKPRLILRAVRLDVHTAEGNVGRTVTFQRGLNILRAGNTSGKSTTVQAIIYALGLEGMLSPKREVPLPHSMTDRVTVDGVDQLVISSSVSLEFENASGAIVTATRQVKITDVDSSVISVEFGPGITEPTDYPTSDYFVRRPGAAQRESGFHHYLSNFLGWKLPQVAYMDGSEKPLYSECIFPFFYVEQKHGWSGLPPRIPTYFGIREVEKRSFEYILDLDVFQRTLLRQRLKSNMLEIESAWQVSVSALNVTARAAGVTVRNEPRRVSDYLNTNAPIFTALAAGEWIPVDVALDRIRRALHEQDQNHVKTAEEVAPELEADLQVAEDSLRLTLSTLTILIEERVVLAEQKRQLDLRLDALNEDLQRHKDASMLVRLGAKHLKLLAVDHICPTCHQDVADGMDISRHVMTTEENIAFIERQRNTFFATSADTARSIQSLHDREKDLRLTLSTLRRQVRQIKDTLTGPSGAPSIAEISNRAALQDQLDRLVANERTLEQHREALQALAVSHREQALLLAGVANSTLSDNDNRKLNSVEQHLRRQLHRYQFDSLRPEDVEINRETYRPSHEGYELGFDISASDMIRVIWSYLISVLRVGEEHDGNHLGLLIFDEPKQQETAQDSYRQLLQEAAEQGQRGSQIIIATSEDIESLTEMLRGTYYKLIHIPEGEKILTPVRKAD